MGKVPTLSILPMLLPYSEDSNETDFEGPLWGLNGTGLGIPGHSAYHQLQLMPMPIGAAEQGATGKTQGLTLGDKGLPFSGHDFPQSTWPRRGQAGTDVPGDAGHTRQKPCALSQ